MPSFDIVSELDLQEMDNAVNQTAKEVLSRFDFRGANPQVEFTRKDKKIKLSANSEQKVQDIIGVLQSKVIKRGIDIRSLKAGKIEPAGGMTHRCLIELVEGIDRDNAKKITSFIKDLPAKVQAAIHDDKVRVTGKKKDDLQSIMQSVKQQGFEVPLQFNNFRD